jgi:predicted MFS family arabinose efflux permease
VLFPLVLRDQLHVDVSHHWQTYLPVFILSIVFMVPMIIIAEKKQKMKTMFLAGISLVILAELGLYVADHYGSVFVALVGFFAGFNFLEASLPSLVAKVAPADMKGTAMGLFSSSQFLGAFAGGVIGGYMLGYESTDTAFLDLGLILGIWWLVALFMKNPRPVSSKIVSLSGMDESAMKQFWQQAEVLPGVQEINVYLEDRVAYLKIEKMVFDPKSLDALLAK